MEDREKREIGSSIEELPFRSDGARTPASVAGGLAATMVREGSLAEAPVQLAERQPIFPRQGDQLASWVGAESDEIGVWSWQWLVPRISAAAHRWLSSACPSQKQYLCQLRRSCPTVCFWLHEMCNSNQAPRLRISNRNPEFLTFRKGTQHPCLYGK